MSSLPPIWLKNPTAWFCFIESVFYNHGMDCQLSRFHYVVAALTPEICIQFSDVLVKPPFDCPYNFLKAEILRHFSVSNKQHIPQLLSDRQPYQFLTTTQRSESTFSRKYSSNYQYGYSDTTDFQIQPDDMSEAIYFETLDNISNASVSVVQCPLTDFADVSHVDIKTMVITSHCCPATNTISSTLTSISDQYSSREICHLDFISQNTSDICHVKNKDNNVADYILCPLLNNSFPQSDLVEMVDLHDIFYLSILTNVPFITNSSFRPRINIQIRFSTNICISHHRDRTYRPSISHLGFWFTVDANSPIPTAPPTPIHVQPTHSPPSIQNQTFLIAPSITSLCSDCKVPFPVCFSDVIHM